MQRNPVELANKVRILLGRGQVLGVSEAFGEVTVEAVIHRFIWKSCRNCGMIPRCVLRN